MYRYMYLKSILIGTESCFFKKKDLQITDYYLRDILVFESQINI